MPSIPDTLRMTAARCPDREALVFGAVRRTYRELCQEVERTAAALAARGIAPGDRVLLVSPNSDAFVIAIYAVLQTGAILVPGNPRNAPPEVAHLVTDSGASTVLYASELGAAGADVAPGEVGVPHPDYGESILAVIVPADGASAGLTVEALREWARDRIADYKAPHAVVVHPIPRNPSGKIQKHLLRAELRA
jgi:acyl-CoA synthetase (AMP-forming)/AMP-acid ligase II